MSYPVAPKTSAAGVSAAVSGAALWILGRYLFRGNVPDGIASMIYIAVPGAVAFAAAYLAPHQPRPSADGYAAIAEAAARQRAAESRYPSSNVTVRPGQVPPPSTERLEAPPVAPAQAERLVIPGGPEPPPDVMPAVRVRDRVIPSSTLTDPPPPGM